MFRSKFRYKFIEIMRKQQPLLFECIIPKGTKYWINVEEDELCSEKLILQKEIKPVIRPISEIF